MCICLCSCVFFCMCYRLFAEFDKNYQFLVFELISIHSRKWIQIDRRVEWNREYLHSATRNMFGPIQNNESWWTGDGTRNSYEIFLTPTEHALIINSQFEVPNEHLIRFFSFETSNCSFFDLFHPSVVTICLIDSLELYEWMILRWFSWRTSILPRFNRGWLRSKSYRWHTARIHLCQWCYPLW